MSLTTWMKRNGFLKDAENMPHTNAVTSQGTVPDTAEPMPQNPAPAAPESRETFSLDNGAGCPPNVQVDLPNGWVLEFTWRGEWKMGCEYWGLVLRNDTYRWRAFADAVAWTGNGDPQRFIALSPDARYGLLKTKLNGEYLIDFHAKSACCISMNLHLTQHERYLTIIEKSDLEYTAHPIVIDGKTYAPAFPFVPMECFADYMKRLKELRISQLQQALTLPVHK
jgi:hypothetical protein